MESSCGQIRAYDRGVFALICLRGASARRPRVFNGSPGDVRSYFAFVDFTHWPWLLNAGLNVFEPPSLQSLAVVGATTLSPLRWSQPD
ncbi:hypothetical protein [Arthrobacter sp. CG_A4]|uniref:hypothetical protein n=1 Tax=Arthrobacter sp. CG_A4 TaxID=3071706 RepID=UPI002E010A93|nr:hypothetical protein [Arthrobacter sp. CG_A4]